MAPVNYVSLCQWRDSYANCLANDGRIVAKKAKGKKINNNHRSNNPVIKNYSILVPRPGYTPKTDCAETEN